MKRRAHVALTAGIMAFVVIGGINAIVDGLAWGARAGLVSFTVVGLLGFIAPEAIG